MSESDDQIRPRGGSLRPLATALALSGDEQARLTAAARGTNGSDRVPRRLPADIAGLAGRVSSAPFIAELAKTIGPTVAGNLHASADQGDDLALAFGEHVEFLGGVRLPAAGGELLDQPAPISRAAVGARHPDVVLGFCQADLTGSRT